MSLGMFAFEIQNIQPGAAATVRITTPADVHVNSYVKQNPTTGALTPFDFDGTTGAEFVGPNILLHFVDGGRGDADGKANGVIVDPGGPTWTPVVVNAKVREVTFAGADLINIVADPGTPAYPAGPQWVDSDLNGVIDAPGDRALPIGYPRNTDSVVSARFSAFEALWPTPPSNYSLMVRGTSATTTAEPVYYVVPPTPVTLEGGDLVLAPTTINNPFPTFVNYGTLPIDWQWSNNGGLTWYAAGRSENELYVTLAAPDVNPVYHTFLHLSVPISAQYPAVTESRVVTETYKSFQARTIKTRHNLPLWDGHELRYYGEWNASGGTAAELLEQLDGACGGFADLFVRSVRAAGVRKTVLPIEAILVGPVVSEAMLIRNWDFVGNGTSGDNNYPYQNSLANPAQTTVIRKTVTGKWEYFWGAVVEVGDGDGLPGQNTTNPKADFDNHWLVRIGTTIYDPSYGTVPFVDLPTWEAVSVAGFAKFDPIGANSFRAVFRKNPPGADIDLKQSPLPV